MDVRHRLCAVLVVLFGVGAAASASAHHSFSGAFDVDGHIKLTGVLSKIDWINPHIYLYLDVTGADGQVTTWAIETLPTNHLRNVGLTRQGHLERCGGGRGSDDPWHPGLGPGQ